MYSVEERERPAERPGEVIRRYRLAEGLTLAQAGELCAMSGSQVSRYERGLCQADVTRLRLFARVLRIPPQHLGLAPLPERHGATAVRRTQYPPSVASEPHEDGDETVRRREMLRLTGVAGAMAVAGAGPADAGSAKSIESILLRTGASTEPLTWTAFDQRRQAAWNAYESANYARLTGILPALVDGAQAGVHTAKGPDRERFTSGLAEAWTLTSHLGIKINDDAAAWVAADRALSTARTCESSATLTHATKAVAISMRRAGHLEGATTLLSRTAADLGGESTGYASLLCAAAYASAQNGRRDTALAFLDEAEQAAARSSGRASGRTAVVLGYRVSVFNALFDSAAALDAARRVAPADLPNGERYARWAIDTARAWDLHGNPDRALHCLLAAEQAAPEELRRPSVRAFVASLLSRSGVPSGLLALASRTGALA